MLYVGYLGETGALSRHVADLVGFVPFFIVFGLIFRFYVYPTKFYSDLQGRAHSDWQGKEGKPLLQN
jgi:hypothetical protein